MIVVKGFNCPKIIKKWTYLFFKIKYFYSFDIHIKIRNLMKKNLFFLSALVFLGVVLSSCEEKHDIKPQNPSQITGDNKTIIGGW